MKFRRFLYRAYRSGGVFYPLRQRFTKGGLLFAGLLAASAFIGLDTNRTLVYEVFTFTFALLLVAFIWSLFFRLRVTPTRMLPKFGSVGESLEYRVRIKNDTSKPQQGLLLREQIADPRPTLEEFLYTPEPGEEKRNAYDRTLLVYRWSWIVAQKQIVKMKEHPLPPLPPNGETEVRIEVTPLRRGQIRLTGLTIARPDPLNVFKSNVHMPLPESIIILPKRYEVPALQLPGTRKFKLGGVSLALSVGESEEFVALRDYRPGDPLRRIHWRSWAKIGKPVVKEYQDEYFVRHALILDTFQQTAFSAVFEEAVSVAASFASTVKTQDSLLDLMFIGTEAYCFTVGRGLGFTAQMLEILASVTPCVDKPFSVLPPLVLERASYLSGCICIFLTWDAERKNFVNYLQSLGVPLLVLVIVDGKATPVNEEASLTDVPKNFHRLEVGKIQEGLAKL